MDYLNLCKTGCVRAFFSKKNKYNKSIKNFIDNEQFFLVLNNYSHIKINHCFICGGNSRNLLSKKECNCGYLSDLAKDKSNGIYQVRDSNRFLFLSSDRVVIWDDIAFCPNCGDPLEGLSAADTKATETKVSKNLSQVFKVKTISEIKTILGEPNLILNENEIYTDTGLNLLTQKELVDLNLPTLRRIYLYDEVDDSFDIKILEFSDETIQITQIQKKQFTNIDDTGFIDKTRSKIESLKSLDEIKKTLAEPDFIYQELWGTDIKEELFYLSLSDYFALYVQEKKSGKIDFQFQKKV